MPPSPSALSRVALPTLALLASSASAAAEAAAAPDPVTTPATTAGGASVFAAPAAPANGILARILTRGLRVANGNTVAVRGRSTTAPIVAQLRVGSRGRVIAQATVAANHRFRLQGRAHPGESLRLLVHRTDGGPEQNDRPVGVVRRLRLRSTTASWYGPGLFGNRTACGQTLTPGLKGVAHKQLPCGTRLTVRFRGRSTSAVVVDRGPFHSGREFDLTYATAQAIGFKAVGQVWVSR